ncbi:MAG: YgjV family protein [Minisyncoccia bacterium]
MIIISSFIVSQIAMFVAMIFDFLSLQHKRREYTFLCLIFSSALISAHYFLLDKTTAGIIVFFSVLRFITCYFTTNKKFLIIFLILNTITLLATYKEIYDLLIYIGLFVFIIGNFEEDNRRMRKIMMAGTSILVLYNIIIFSPMGAIAEGSFLLSNFIGYYRYYLRKDNMINIKNKTKTMKKEASFINPRSAIAVTLIVGIGAVIGLSGYMTVIKPNKVAAPAEVKVEKNRADEQKVAEMILKGYMEVLAAGDKDGLLPYVSPEMEKKIGGWPDDLGSLNMHLGKFEILSAEKINEQEFRFTVREYQELDGSGVIGYADNAYTIKKTGNRYLVSSIEEGEYAVLVETSGWKTFQSEEKGYEYKYPENFFLQDPDISIAKMAGPSSLEGCYTRKFSGFDVKKVKIGDIFYCLTESTEGTAGSTYVDSSYTNVDGDRIITLHFIVRYPDCGALGEKTELKFIDCERLNLSGPKMTEKTVETFKLIP